MGMGMGGNGNYFSGINGNGNKVSEFLSPGVGVGMKLWEWEGMVCQKLFPHTSNYGSPPKTVRPDSP